MRGEEPTRNVVPQYEQLPACGTDVSSGNVVPAPGPGSAGCTVQGVQEVTGQVPLRTQGVQLFEFLRRKPTQNLSDIGHVGFPSNEVPEGIR